MKETIWRVGKESGTTGRENEDEELPLSTSFSLPHSKLQKLSLSRKTGIYAVVQFCPWFNFSLFLYMVLYVNLLNPNIKI